VVAPLPLVGEVDAPLALAAGDHDRTVRVEDRLVAELVRLTAPDLEPRVVDGVHQRPDGVLVEAAAEVAGG
jgi:hypothetical protein